MTGLGTITDGMNENYTLVRCEGVALPRTGLNRSKCLNGSSR